MNIILSPIRMDKTLEVLKYGDSLTLNGEIFDFSYMREGSTLPCGAINSEWFAGAVEMINGEITLTIFLPNPVNYSPEQAFPVPLLSVPDGLVALPQPLPVPVVTPDDAVVKELSDE